MWKKLNDKRLMILPGMMIAMAANAGIINENYIWEYEAPYMSGVTRFKMKFDGIVEKDGMSYHNFRTLSHTVYVGSDEGLVEESTTDYPYEEMYLLRESGELVYIRVRPVDVTETPAEGEIPGEAVIYDFSMKVGDTRNIYTNSGNTECELVDIRMEEMDGQEGLVQYLSYDNSIKYKLMFSDIFGNLGDGTLATIDTDRITGDPVYPADKYPQGQECRGIKLKCVYDLSGNIIWRDDIHQSIEDIQFDNHADIDDTTLYDLQGRELSEPQLGQPYIRAGKIHIAK